MYSMCFCMRCQLMLWTLLRSSLVKNESKHFFSTNNFTRMNGLNLFQKKKNCFPCFRIEMQRIIRNWDVFCIWCLSLGYVNGNFATKTSINWRLYWNHNKKVANKRQTHWTIWMIGKMVICKQIPLQTVAIKMAIWM